MKSPVVVEADVISVYVERLELVDRLRVLPVLFLKLFLRILAEPSHEKRKAADIALRVR